MSKYSNIITINENNREVWCIDPSIGCGSGMSNTIGGCYGDCYAAKAASRYGHNFHKTVYRGFKNKKHISEILTRINSIKMPFIRMGCSGDPSEDWGHTISILNKLKTCNKEIVIITRHWTILSNEQLYFISKCNISINTSVSALDSDIDIQHSLSQYNRIKGYCNSSLRVITCDFNLDNNEGHRRFVVQSELMKNESVIDTVFRPSKNNRLVVDGVINISESRFNNSKQLVSKFNRKTYLGKCSSCKEMCGAKMNYTNISHDRPGIVNQLKIWN